MAISLSKFCFTGLKQPRAGNIATSIAYYFQLLVLMKQKFDPALADKAVRRLSDKSRKSIRVGREIVVPHKFKEDGTIVTVENFNPKSDLSRLNVKHWQLLEAMKANSWDIAKASESVGLSLDEAQRLFKRIKYFEEEATKEKALASVLSPDFVVSKHMENVMTNQLEDGQRDSLKELAKIQGLHKNSASVSVTQNFLTLPSMTPEVESQLKALAESALDAEIVGEQHAA